MKGLRVRRFKKDLECIGCYLEEDVADDIILQCHRFLNKHLTIESLLYRPNRAIAYAKLVCWHMEIDATDWAVEVVLRRLVNLRKMGRVWRSEASDLENSIDGF